MAGRVAGRDSPWNWVTTLEIAGSPWHSRMLPDGSPADMCAMRRKWALEDLVGALLGRPVMVRREQLEGWPASIWADLRVPDRAILVWPSRRLWMCRVFAPSARDA